MSNVGDTVGKLSNQLQKLLSFSVSCSLSISLACFPFSSKAYSVDNSSTGANGVDGVSVLGVVVVNPGTGGVPSSINQGIGGNETGVSVSGLGGRGGGGVEGFIGLVPDGKGGLRLAIQSGFAGGTGGHGGNHSVTVNAGASSTTSSRGQHAVTINSRGGTGGLGGGGFSVEILKIGYSVNGGNGGTGGAGGNISVTNNGSLRTSGTDSVGVFATSVGGSGGSGGSSGGLGSVGGSGGAAAGGGTVTVNNFSSITTTGEAGRGILAQSFGGAGSGGGIAFGLLFSQGGNAGNAGDGGDVNVTNSGTLTTYGRAASGILAQSLGGGGGAGGSSVSITALGGTGSNGGSANNVRVSNTLGGSITTSGEGATGILGQSTGGAGGDAGVSVGLVAIGGSGDAGGNGSTVVLRNDGSILTKGNSASGIKAQSIGGGGGNGGISVGLVSVGGSGNAAGNGGFAGVFNTGKIETRGASSAAIVAQSIGGGGGDGGVGVGVAVGPGAASVAIGGSGGAGGHGGTVRINEDMAANNLNSDLLTKGRASTGVLAQSIGGGGGNGGFAGSFSLAATASAAVAVGGSGGRGGHGGSVDARMGGTIVTEGEDASGIVGQSIGGGGGNGSFALALAGAGQASASVAVGQAGGAGGNGGTVSVTNWANIQTKESRSLGILAQSIGGGGGNAGYTISGAAAQTFAGNVNVGANGGAAGSGGSLTVTNEGAITTNGENSKAILAQSVGGGGGMGGFGIGVALSRTAAASVNVGGSGGAGKHGGNVTVINKAALVTTKDSSFGIEAQSVGGAGGTAGFAIGAGATLDGAGALAVNIGGLGGGGDHGGAVVVENTGSIFTSGNRSTALLAQSIGGGGGNGGFAIGQALTVTGAAGVSTSIGGTGGSGSNGGSVTVKSHHLTTPSGTGATIQTSGTDAIGIHAHSIGGGGGMGGFAIASSVALSIGSPTNRFAAAVSVGGTGGNGGAGGQVTIETKDRILTTGDGANGILAQSTGGGGGYGGFAVSFGSAGKAMNSASATVAIGGTGGTGATGGVVMITTGGAIETRGNYATAVQAQSVGGGGGMGGFGAGLSTGLGADSAQIAVSIGGTGGTGNHGGDVTINQNGSILTTGGTSWGILAQSIGGGGGNGALALSGALGGINAKNAATTIGGSGGSGSNGGVVTIANTGSIRTEGESSFAIFAQSIGGGGGTGGSAGALAGGATGIGAGKNINLSTTVGGSGGNGSNGGVVNVTNDGNLTTLSEAAIGIYAQSIGGGGGDGGSAMTGLLGLVGGREGKTINAGVTIGGSGGSGQVGGAVNVVNRATIRTAGADAQGIRAVSVGGGGGAGARAGSLSLIQGRPKGCRVNLNFACKAPTNFKDSNINLQLLIGGTGGSGNHGGDVDVNNDGMIFTTGPAAHAIQAQSIGAGGGSAGSAKVGIPTRLPTEAVLPTNAIISYTSKQGELANHAVSIGGKGGATGNGGTVAVNNSATLSVSGDDGMGVLAQSIGGGGGVGGLANSGRTGTFSVGGEGGSAGNGGAVTVTLENGSVISTTGNGGHGAFAQSVGGGGGIGGGGQAGRFIGGGHDRPNLNPKVFAVSYLQVAIAGSGGPSGDGGVVAVSNDGSIQTLGNDATGIVAQSVGGGGGSAGGRASATFSFGGTGGAQGNGGKVTVSNTGAIDVAGERSSGIEAQSIGGGGGRGGQAGATAVLPSETQAIVLPGLLSVGGTGGAGGSGGEVGVTNSGDIFVRGAHSYGIIAQSIGGGGGIGGNTLSLLAVGGGDGVSGDGGKVKVTHQAGANITTFADKSLGILAQSVGGGGGATGLATGALSFGGKATTSGKGGKVDVETLGDISTAGAGSHGVLAQSLGGGGGTSGGADGIVAISGSGATGSDGHAVDVLNRGSISTSGKAAHGIIAQSIGGGGGFVTATVTSDSVFNFSGTAGGQGDGGRVIVNNYGSVTASGNSSIGILAQSDGQTPTGDVDVYNWTMGTSVIGGKGGAAISILHGRNNQVINMANVSNAGGVSELAILGGDQNETVLNNGVISGNIDLGAGNNQIRNNVTGTLNSGAVLNAGNTNASVRNLGTVSVGGSNNILTTALNGSYSQDGKLLIELRHIPHSTQQADTDVLDISGRAVVEGELQVSVLNAQQAAPGIHSVAVLDAAQGLTQGFMPTLNAPNSAVAAFSLSRGSNTINLDYEINYAPAGLTGAALAFGRYLNQAQANGGGSGLETIIATLTQPGSTVQVLQDSYASLDPQPISTGISTSTLTVSDFANSLRSCAQKTGPNRFIAEGNCNWMARTQRDFDVSQDGTRAASHTRVLQTTFGVQRRADTGDFWGIGGSIGSAGVTSGTAYQSSGEVYQLGAVLKRQQENRVLSGSFILGAADFNAQRSVTVGGVTSTAFSQQPLRFVSTALKYAQVYERGASFFKPLAEVSVTGMQQKGFSETGAGAANMTIDGRTDWRADLELGLGAGREFQLPGGETVIRIHGELGLQHRILGEEATLSARFAGSQSAGAGLQTGSGEDKTLAKVAIGVDLLGSDGGALRLDASSRLGERTRDVRAGLKFSLDF